MKWFQDEQPASPRPGKAGRLLLLGISAWCFLHVFRGTSPSFADDRWWRKGLEDQFPAGEDPHHVLLVNAGSVPMFTEIRGVSWDGPRAELLLPGQKQWVDVPGPREGGDRLQLDVRPLDMATAEHRTFELPEAWSFWRLAIGADGQPGLDIREGGDTFPKRHLLGIESAYALPVRIELPFDAHERPVGEDLVRRSWIGPGTQDDSDQCACAIRPGVQVSYALPRASAPALQLDEPIGADTTTRIVLRWDGTVTRDTIPLAQRVQHWAGF